MNTTPPGTNDNERNRRDRRNRMLLLVLVVLFVLPIAAAWLINRGGLVPAPTRQHGELLQPPLDLREVVPLRADGSAYEWNPEARLWRIVATPPAQCDAACETLAADLDKVWRLFGRNADRVEILWAGEWPAGVRAPDTLVPMQANTALRARLPGNDALAGTPVYVIDPNGFLVLRYPPGFDPAGLRSDVARLVKLK
jgi:hypothetical protein